MAAQPKNLINLQSVAKGYGSRSVLDGISLGVATGDRIGVVGRNGDGKSTLLRLMAGIEQPDEGVVTRVGGLELVLVAQQDDLLDDASVRDELVGGRADHEWAGDRRFRSVLDGLLGGVGIDRLADGIDTRIGDLSGGERRRIALARALIDSPELLLLDEPTASLDPDAGDKVRTRLMQYQKESGATLLLASHNMPEVERMCDAVYMMRAGAIVDSGSPVELVSRYGRSTMEEVFLDVARRQGVAA